MYFIKRTGGCRLSGSFIDYEELATFDFGGRDNLRTSRCMIKGAGRTTKKVLMILGCIFVVLVVVVAVGIAIVAVKGNALDKESKRYVDAAIPAIVSQWDITEIQKRASAEFKAAVNDENLEKLVRMFRRLGKFKAYDGAKGDANISVTSDHGKVISAAYVGSAEFETGPAEIKMSLIKHGDQWQLLGIQINSKVFFEQP
ncbi:MAG TPA: hypothetical protein VMQ67_00465 [Candidatus Saccharimonadales bacterium]|nr:hypothetical protein [Candidatus Saccharimonadales bacterium]